MTDPSNVFSLTFRSLRTQFPIPCQMGSAHGAVQPPDALRKTSAALKTTRADRRSRQGEICQLLYLGHRVSWTR